MAELKFTDEEVKALKYVVCYAISNGYGDIKLADDIYHKIKKYHNDMKELEHNNAITT